MSVVMCGDFGMNEEGLHTVSINATSRQDLLDIIIAAKAAGAIFYEMPQITYKAKTFHVLLQFTVKDGTEIPLILN